MQSLKQVITALRREIEDALEQRQSLPRSTRLEADRAVITLNFQLNQNGAGDITFAVPPADSGHVGGQTHSVAIEFRLSSAASASDTAKDKNSERSPSMTNPSTQPPQNADLTRLTQQLSDVFGAPGFDSSARADVFREALEALSDNQADLLARALQGEAIPDSDKVVQRSLSLLHRVCHSGPSGAIKGKAILADAFKNYPMKLIVRHVDAVWKSQQDWMS